ncbi:MAG: hypothetical protein Q9157_009224 [Trypethelium eluteriae]
MGSAGGGQGSGSRVHPGKKMPGRMGGEQVTIQNLKVLKVDEENGLVVVNGMSSSMKVQVSKLTTCIGCVSGPKGCLVKIQDAIKKPWPEVLPGPPLPETPQQHLQAMNVVFSNLQDDMFRRFLRQSDTRAKIVELLDEADAGKVGK